ncbi:MAG: hypothetical protein IPF57_03995 [Gammaproteobacteria bacterium]|nr:hypothetical protein [Gammaproteobacteria bacterium]
MPLPAPQRRLRPVRHSCLIFTVAAFNVCDRTTIVSLGLEHIGRNWR